MHRFTLAAAVAATTLGIGGVALARTHQFRAEPAGSFEVPAVDTAAGADFKLKVTGDGTARFDLKITDPITDVVASHLHLGPAGTNGPVVVWLYPHEAKSPQLIPGEFDGRLDSGTITVDDLVGPLAGDWDGFVEAASSGGLYVNVHTSTHPSGEIRGQVATQP